MNLIRRTVETLVERFVASVGTLFTARIESVAALTLAEQQDELEERARQFENDGKAQLAADLRSRASQLAAKTPGASGHDALRHLQLEHDSFATPHITHAADEEDVPRADEQQPEPTPTRPARRRSARRSKTN